MVVSKQAKRHKRDAIRQFAVTTCCRVPILTITEAYEPSFMRFRFFSRAIARASNLLRFPFLFFPFGIIVFSRVK
jgi:hypothetical protein